MALLDSIMRFDVGETEIILVDNGAAIDNGDYFRGIFPSLIYLHSKKNLGFAGGNNLGVRDAKGEYLLFLNNDTEITSGFVQTLCDELNRNPNMGLLSPLILYHENKSKVQYAGYTPMNYLTGRNNGIGNTEDDKGQYDGMTIETGYCHGAAMMCRKADLDRVGLMEEHFFLYYEELDWCEKFRRAGLKIGFTGKAKIYHKESMSVGKDSPLKTYFMVRNRWLFIRRNAIWQIALAFSCYYLLVAMPVLMARYLAKGRSDLIGAAWRGVKWNIGHSTASRDLGIKLRDV